MILVVALYVVVSAWMTHAGAVMRSRGDRRGAAGAFFVAVLTGADAVLIAWHG